MLEKIENKSLQKQVYDRLKEALTCGEFEPGQAMVIRNLADKLGCSPMPVRQSLQRLVSEHALTAKDSARSTIRVPCISPEAYEDIKSVRKILEPAAAARAAERSTPELVRELHALDKKMKQAIEAGDAQQAAKTNRAFHFAIYQAADSLTLLRSIESLWLQSGPYFRILIGRYFPGGTSGHGTSLNHNSHGSIIDAIENRDPEAAYKALSDDIHIAAKYYIV
ncbi:GntR family transcriptional regulator [Pseudomaricurvus alkylphenolicus]|uniref:GntR family transcriptional regulator n=1 Tax=Pseudomaricurvus alkylphenolicus TaxID=1306991 RepID=UPI00141FB4A7|nr:GntR family transcriptional regulator [Pseudomaricurvus alkylphenolicus]NIB40618.1 GntR family transcriptional regulator [Pseudomaricurvus alkylphenolicus]